MNKLLIICGPTATGKTALAAKLAKQLHGELISADSRQVYRGMDLTTGKDRPDVPVWLYDVVDPDEAFSVSQWVNLAQRAIEDISNRNKLPIIIGGTGLYIRAILSPLDTIDIPPDHELRKKLLTMTTEELQKMTHRGAMNDSDWKNPRRLIRRIEIANAIRPGLAIPQGLALKKDVLMIGLMASQTALDERIDKRYALRMKQGMKLEEAELLSRYDKHLPSMSAIGVNEHAYARRQMTWFKKQKNIQWFDIMDEKCIEKVIRRVTVWYEN